MLENDYNPIVTKNELIDILYDNFKNSISKNDIEYLMNDNIKLGNKNNKIYSITKEKILLYIIENKNFNYNKENYKKAILSKEFKEIYYFKIDNNKYIYYYTKPNIEPISNYYLIILEQLEYILKNNFNNGINNDELKHIRAACFKDLNSLRENEPLNIKFKKYDYIKIICENKNYNYIGINDIIKCTHFLEYNKEYNFLTIEEQISLKLIILLGIENIYLNNSEYYQEQVDLNQIIEKINEYILFIEDNLNNIKDEIVYSFDFQYTFNLKEYCSRIFAYLKDNYNVWNRNTSLYEKVDNEFISFLRYISFDYYVINKKYENANEIFEKELPLFKYLKESLYKSEHMIRELIDVVLATNYKNDEDEMEIQKKKLSSILSTENKRLLYNYFARLDISKKIKRNTKVLLRFYIDCYYYFVNLNDEENANKIFEFLLYFKDGYGIEDFILKCRYTKKVEDLNGEKIDNIDNIDEIDKALNKLDKKINELNLVNQFDIDEVETTYNNINFKNFKQENSLIVKKCIATGDKIMNTFKKLDIDFSNAVVEWSKAVETEMDEKLFSDEIINFYEKSIIEKKFTKILSNGNELHFRLKNSKDITVGIFNEMEKYTNGKQNLLEHLYDRFFSQHYKLDKGTYKKLCEDIKKISKPRNDSAHKGKTINESTAMDCKEKILASERILEILSKLEERKK